MPEYSIKFLNDLIKQIGLGINISRTYPKGHPSLQPVVQRLRILLKEIPIEQDSISMVIVEDIIMIGNERFDSRNLPIVKSLVQRFNQLGVKSITFNVELSEDDIKEFFAAMAATPADISDYGDIVALVRARGITGIKVNKFRVGVISTDEQAQAISWEQFLDSLSVNQGAMSDEQRIKELSGFLAGVGLSGEEPAEVQTGKIIAGLEKLALLIADQYGEDRWNEYSVVFSRMLGALSPTIKKNILKYRTENKKISTLFKNLIPTMSDEDIIDIISVKAKEKSPELEQEIIDLLKNVTGSRLPGILSTLRVNVPELDFEKIVSRLMTEMKTTRGEKTAQKFLNQNLESEMRTLFPRLRSASHEERIKAVDELMEYAERLFDGENYDLVRLLIDRLDTMADAETDLTTFKRVIAALKALYEMSEVKQKDDLTQFVSKKFGKHLLRKDAALLDRKKIIIKAINAVKDQNYIPELISLLWDPGTFVEARAGLIAMAEFSVPMLIGTLKDTEDRAIRMKIIDVLVRSGEGAINEVKKMLSADEWYIRRNGVYILGEMRNDALIDTIGSMINDENEQVQLATIEKLVYFKDPRVKGYLRQILSSSSKEVVVSALKYLDADDIKPRLKDLLTWVKTRKSIPDKREEQFRQEIIKLVAGLGEDSVIETLFELLNEKSLFKKNILQPTKKAVLDAFVRIGSPRAKQAIESAAAHKDKFVAVTAQELLKRHFTS